MFSSLLDPNVRLIRIKMTILKTPSSTYELDSLFTATNRWEILNQQQWKVLCSIKRFINYCKVYREGFLNVFSKFTPDVRHCVNNVILKSMAKGVQIQLKPQIFFLVFPFNCFTTEKITFTSILYPQFIYMIHIIYTSSY